MTQLTEIPMGYIWGSGIIRFVIMIAFIYWTTRWEGGNFWKMDDDKTAWCMGAAFLFIHITFLPMSKLSMFNEYFVGTGGSTFIGYFMYDFGFRFISLLLYWGWLYGLVLIGINMCVNYIPNVGGLIQPFATVMIIALCLCLGIPLMYIWPFQIL